ncbi:MAG: sterol carrier family protein [Corynebacterium sp.]|nr:sterol carrier family protein [Corynebacterium sp.]
MAPIDIAGLRADLQELRPWIVEPSMARPPRALVARAVRVSARLLAQDAPGHSVEVRIPPFVAVQCIEGPSHTRGTPPNVVETDPHTWLGLVLGEVALWQESGRAHPQIQLSGTRAGEIGAFLPLIR